MSKTTIKQEKYKYGFADADSSLISFDKGLSEETVRKISKIKNDPSWMLELRLKAYHAFIKIKNPSWGPDLSFIDFNDYIYYASSVSQSWNDIPQKIKDTFKKLGVSEAEAKFLSGAGNQYDSEMVHHSLQEDLQRQGVIFSDIETALKTHPEIVKKYFGTLVNYQDNKYAALNTAVWSGGSFIYIPKDVYIKNPLQAYFRINKKSVGQFERTLIILEPNAKIHYLEGCTAPIYDANNLHAAVVEVFVNDGATCRYTTIQNWSDNVLNLATKRARVSENANMIWVDGNIGSKLNMKYPSTILAGKDSKGKCITVAVSHKGIIQDTGAKMIHLGENTRSQIISKSICHSGGESNYRGLVYIGKNAHNSYCEVKCDNLILDKYSKSLTYPKEIIKNITSSLKHEAKTTSLDQDQLFFLMSKNLDYKTAKHLIILGFIEPFSEEIPAEYAVELNRLLKLDLLEE